MYLYVSRFPDITVLLYPHENQALSGMVRWILINHTQMGSNKTVKKQAKEGKTGKKIGGQKKNYVKADKNLINVK